MHSRVHAGRAGASNCEAQGIPRARTLGRDRVARQADGLLQSGESQQRREGRYDMLREAAHSRARREERASRGNFAASASEQNTLAPTHLPTHIHIYTHRHTHFVKYELILYICYDDNPYFIAFSLTDRRSRTI